MRETAIFTMVLMALAMTGCAANRNAEEVSILVYENGADIVDDTPQTPPPPPTGTEQPSEPEATPPPAKKIRGPLKSVVVCKGGVTPDRCAGQGLITSLANDGTIEQRTDALRVLTNSYPPPPSNGNGGKQGLQPVAVPRPGPEAHDSGGHMSDCEKSCVTDFRKNAAGYDQCTTRCSP